jgi:predicted DNA-binding transcriptional regulator AlpA
MIYVQNTIPQLALTSGQVIERLSISRTTLQKLIREKKLTPLLHIKKNYQVFAMSEILELLTPQK